MGEKAIAPLFNYSMYFPFSLQVWEKSSGLIVWVLRNNWQELMLVREKDQTFGMNISLLILSLTGKPSLISWSGSWTNSGNSSTMLGSSSRRGTVRGQ